jgi:hypothetical protein
MADTLAPLLAVWEDAIDRGFIVRRRAGQELLLGLAPLGRDFLQGNTPGSP